MNGTRPRPPPHPEAPAGWAPSELTVLLQRVLQLSAEVRHAMAVRMALSPHELAAMQHLMGEPMGPVELSRRLHMTSASATVLVRRLEHAGHVRREPHPDDRRRRVVHPTREGAVAVFAEVAPLVAGLVEAEADLDDTQCATVAGYLERVAQALAAGTRQRRA